MPLNTVRGDVDAPIQPLRGKTVAVIGFGNQGSAHALNLRDSGLRIVVGSRQDSGGARRAAQLGFEVLSIGDAALAADLAIIALPDQVQPSVYGLSIGPFVRPGTVVGFLHGFAIRFGLIEPAEGIGVVMIAPKGPGRTLRERFTRGLGIPCLMAMYRDTPTRGARAFALAWANGIGCARAGIIETTFAAETDTDLFGEQAVLCGGMTWLIHAAFETLVDAGYPPELAYLECCHEVKQVADLVYEGGPAAMMEAISNTAEFGAHAVGPAIVDAAMRERMRAVLADIQSGRFAERFMRDHSRGFQWFSPERARLAGHAIEDAGRFVRALMPLAASSAEKAPRGSAEGSNA